MAHLRHASWVCVGAGAVLTALAVFPTREGLAMAAGSVACSIAARTLGRLGF